MVVFTTPTPIILGLSKLQKVTPSTKNVDAMSIKGERYAIKSLTGSATGMFHSLNVGPIDGGITNTV